mmetsp:Transcript_27478/g.20636  ORF Transcript_27478/g.20636 Transcript_27478/m.20636 type:complete len:93 (+) Transcript_27478:559-837(+)
MRLERFVSNPKCKDDALAVIHHYLEEHTQLEATAILTEEKNRTMYDEWIQSRGLIKKQYSSISPFRKTGAPQSTRNSEMNEMKRTFNMSLML